MNETNQTWEMTLSFLAANAGANPLPYFIVGMLAFLIYGIIGVLLISGNATKKKTEYVVALFLTFLGISGVGYLMQMDIWVVWFMCGVIGIIAFILSHAKNAHRMKDKFLYVALSLLFVGMFFVGQLAEAITNWLMPYG